MTRDEIDCRLAELYAAALGDAGEHDVDGLSSLELVALAMRVEEAFGVVLPDDVLTRETLRSRPRFLAVLVRLA